MSVVLERHREATQASLFEHLYRRHRRDVYRALLRDLGDPHEAEDATQATFLNAYRALDQGLRPERPRVWLLAIAANVCRQRWRTRTRRPREVELDVDAVDASVDADVREGDVGVALQALRPNHRTVLWLREVEGLSYTEIAERLGLSHSAVEALLFRARRALRDSYVAAEAARRRERRTLAGFLPVPDVLARAAERLGLLLGRPELAAKVVAASLLATSVVVGTTGSQPKGPPRADRPGGPVPAAVQAELDGIGVFALSGPLQVGGRADGRRSPGPASGAGAKKNVTPGLAGTAALVGGVLGTGGGSGTALRAASGVLPLEPPLVGAGSVPPVPVPAVPDTSVPSVPDDPGLPPLPSVPGVEDVVGAVDAPDLTAVP